MALDFPNAPTNGQTYTGPNGVIWTWDGAKWANGTVAGAYAPVLSPVFTGDPQAPTPSPGDSDTSVATTAFVQAAVATANHNTGRNLLHNPLFQVAQRGVGPFVVNGFGLDRWQQASALSNLNVSQQQAVDVARAQIGDEAASSYLYAQATAGTNPTDFSIVQHKTENVRRLAGKTVTVSFYAATSAAGPIGVGIQQDFGTGGSPSAMVVVPGQAITLAATWARYSATFAVPSISGKTLGTANDHGTTLVFWLSAGTNYNTNSGSIGLRTQNVSLWGVQLEIGSVATPLEKPDPRYDLANCQRFYQTGILYLHGYNTAGNPLGSMYSFPVRMRAAPAMTFNTTGSVNSNGFTGPAIASDVFSPFAVVTATGDSYCNGTFTASADL